MDWNPEHTNAERYARQRRQEEQLAEWVGPLVGIVGGALAISLLAKALGR